MALEQGLAVTRSRVSDSHKNADVFPPLSTSIKELSTPQPLWELAESACLRAASERSPNNKCIIVYSCWIIITRLTDERLCAEFFIPIAWNWTYHIEHNMYLRDSSSFSLSWIKWRLQRVKRLLNFHPRLILVGESSYSPNNLAGHKWTKLLMAI